MRAKGRGSGTWVLLIPLLVSAPALAGDVVLEGSIRARETVLLNHDFDGDAGDPNNYATLRTRVAIATTVGQYASAFVQFQDTRVMGEPKDTVTSLEQVDLHQGFIHIHNAFNTTLELKIGRQEMAYGRHRQIGSLDWTDTGRSFDGVLVMYDIEDVGWFHAFGMKTLETGGIVSGVNDGDGVTSQVGGANPEGAFIGGYLRVDVNPETAAEAYVFDLYEDLAPVFDDQEAVIADPSTHRFTVGGRARWRREGDPPIHVYGEGAFQFGTGPETVAEGATEPEDGAKIAAWATSAGARIGLGRSRAWVAGEMSFATGDPTPGTDENQTYRQLFPSEHAALGALDFVGWQNVFAYQGTVGVTPDDYWELWATYHVFQLHAPADTWYGADGRPFEPMLQGHTLFDAALAHEFDLTVTFSPEPDLEFEGIFGIWWPKAWQEQAAALAAGATPEDAFANPVELEPAMSAFVVTTVRW